MAAAVAAAAAVGGVRAWTAVTDAAVDAAADADDTMAMSRACSRSQLRRPWSRCRIGRSPCATFLAPVTDGAVGELWRRECPSRIACAAGSAGRRRLRRQAPQAGLFCGYVTCKRACALLRIGTRLVLRVQQTTLPKL